MPVSRPRIGAFLAAGAVAAVLGWVVGPRLAVAVAGGAAVVIVLLAGDWLRKRLRHVAGDQARLARDIIELRDGVVGLRAEVAGVGAGLADLSGSCVTGDDLSTSVERLLGSAREDAAALVESMGAAREADAGRLLAAVREELAAIERRLQANAGKDREAIERVIRLKGTEAAALETRLRVSASGDLLALEKRLRAERPEPSPALRAVVRRELAQVLAIREVRAMLPGEERLPQLTAESTPPADFLAELISLIRKHPPSIVVGLGADDAAIWAALAIRELGIEGVAVSADHDPARVEATHELLSGLGLQKIAESRYVPLQNLERNGTAYSWYDPAALEDVAACDLLILGRRAVAAVSGDQDALAPLLAAQAAGVHRILVEGPLSGTFPEWSVGELPVEGGAVLLTRKR